MRRRPFLSLLGTASLAAGLSSPLLAEKSFFSRPGMAVRASREKLLSQKNILAAYQSLLDAALEKLFGAKESRNVFGELFTAQDRVALKVNCIAGRKLSTRPELAAAVVTRLKSIGVKPENIIVFDRFGHELKRAGFETAAVAGAKVMGTDELGEGGYGELQSSGRVGTSVSRIITEFSTALINLPVLKDHELCGVAGSLKNHYGSISNPNRYHANGCDPFIADVNLIPDIRNRQRLVIADAGLAQYEGGPGFKARWAWEAGALIAGTDPVAVDSAMAMMLEKERARRGLPSFEEAKRPAKFLATAEARGLGRRAKSILDV